MILKRSLIRRQLLDDSMQHFLALDVMQIGGQSSCPIGNLRWLFAARLICTSGLFSHVHQYIETPSSSELR